MEPKLVNNSRTILLIAITALITALAVGGGIFLWQQRIKQQEIQQIINRPQAEQILPSSQNDTSNSRWKVLYSVQQDSANNQNTIYSLDLDSKRVSRLTEYKNSLLSGESVPKASKTGLIAYVDLDQKNIIGGIDLGGSKKVLTEAERGYEINGFIISDDGNTILSQEINRTEPGTCSNQVNLWKINLLGGQKELLYSNNQYYLYPDSFSLQLPDEAFVLKGELTGDIANCFSPSASLQTINLTNKELTSLNTKNGHFISPNGKMAVYSFSTNPATPLESNPSEKYPIKLMLVDLSNGKEMTLVQSSTGYLYPVSWYSDSQRLLYREEAADNIKDFQNVQGNYKSIDVQSKQVTPLFILPRRNSGLEYEQLIDDSTLIYTVRNDPDWTNGTSLFKINLDGSGKIELDKKVRFMYLIGVTR